MNEFEQFRGTGVAGRKPTKTLPIRPISVRYHTLIPKIYNRNQAPQRVTATERNQTQGEPRPVAYLRRYDFTLAFLA